MGGIYKRCYPVRDKELYDEYLRLHHRCECCGTRHCLSRHHIIGNTGRSDEHTNLLVLCIPLCHNLAEGELVRNEETGLLYETLSIGMCMTLKAMTDPEGFNPWRIEELYGQCLPDFEKLPAWADEIFRRNKRWR